MDRFISTAVTAVVLTVLTVAALNYYGVTCTGGLGFTSGQGGVVGGHGTDANHDHPAAD